MKISYSSLNLSIVFLYIVQYNLINFIRIMLPRTVKYHKYVQKCSDSGECCYKKSGTGSEILEEGQQYHKLRIFGERRRAGWRRGDVLSSTDSLQTGCEQQCWKIRGRQSDNRKLYPPVAVARRHLHRWPLSLHGLTFETRLAVILLEMHTECQVRYCLCVFFFFSYQTQFFQASKIDQLVECK